MLALILTWRWSNASGIRYDQDDEKLGGLGEENRLRSTPCTIVAVLHRTSTAHQANF